MPSTRRGFLTGSVGFVAAIAGCNEQLSQPNGGGSTVTPVDVPRTNTELLEEARTIPRPTVPSAVVVSARHHESAIEHARSLLEAVEEAVEAVVDAADVAFDEPGSPDRSAIDETTQGVTERLEELNASEPDETTLNSCFEMVGELGQSLGYLRAHLGDVDEDELKAAMDDERSSAAALAETFEYRPATPIAEHLPTLARAETRLTGLENHGRAFDNIDTDPDDPYWADWIGHGTAALERHRRHRSDAAAFYRTATDGDAPSIRDAVEVLTDETTDTLESIHARSRERTPPDGESVLARLQRAHTRVGRQSEQRLTALDDDAHPLASLLDAREWLAEYEAVAEAVDRTRSRQSAEFPAAAVVTEKQRAVERIETAAAGTALQRRLSAQSERVLRNADTNSQQRPEADEKTVVYTHFMYVAAGRWAEQGATDGEALAETIRVRTR